MQPYILLILITMGYLMIGTFCGVLFDRIAEPVNGDTTFGVILVFWPVLLAALIIMGLFLIPVKLAGWIYDKLF